MSRTQIRGTQILDSSIQRADLDTTTVGSAVISKIVQGTGISISSTGADSGTGDTTINLSSNVLNVSINYIIDGAGDVITTGSKGYLEIPFNMTITGWSMAANQTGSIIIDVKKCNYAAFPTTSSICGATLPTITTDQKNQNLTLTDWSVSVTTGDILEFVVNSITSIQQVTLSIRGVKT